MLSTRNLKSISFSRILSSGFILLFSFNTYTQNKFSDNLEFRVEGHYGYIIPEYKHFNLIVDRPIIGTELSFVKRSYGNNFWEELYNYPEYGLTVGFLTLGNPTVLGNEFLIYPTIGIPFLNKSKIRIVSQFGFGLGYVTRKFDLETNNKNISVGSHVNIHFNYKLGYTWQFCDNWNWVNNLSFSHFSNANMAEPNLGINSFTATGGFQYLLGERKDRINNEIPEFNKQNQFAFIAGFGGKHTRALTEDIYFTSSFSAEFKRTVLRKIALGAGMDFFYDSSTESEMSAPGKDPYRKIYDFRSGIHISQEVIFDRFGFILQEGIYIGLTNRVNKSVMYNKAIIRYRFSDRFLVQFAVKTHVHILDFPELGIGYYFKQ